MRRYFAFFGGGITLVLALAIVVETPLSYRATLERVGDVQLAEARSAAARVDQFLQSVEATLRESAGVPWADPAFTAADLRAEHHRLMKLIPSIDSIQVLGRDGIPRLAVSRRDLDRPAAGRFEDEALLRRVGERGVGLGRVAFRNGLEPVVALGVRARNDEILVAELNLRSVSDIVTQLRVGSSGLAFLVDAADGIVAHPDAGRTLKKTSEPGRRQIEAIRARLGSRDFADAFESRSADGIAVLTSAVGLPRWGWMVVAEEPLEAALAPVRATVYRLAGLMLAGVLVALLLSAILARRLTKPILSLREGAERITRGDLASRIQVSTGDEVEALARDFNTMAAQLQDYTTGLERKVEEKTARLQEAMRARALFLAAASHDLRQPLYAISILADTLALQELPESARQTLAKQREAIAVLRGLFDNLLDLSRFDSGEVRKSERVASLREILVPVAVEHEVVARSKGLDWHCEIPDAQVRTDPELVRRIAGNLLSNAVRYTPRGRVALVATVQGQEVGIEVSDTGLGIPRELQGKVFEEFVQLDNPSRDRDRGVGLGLSIVKKIDELLGSKLELDSARGEGTRVTFTIPLAEAVAKAAAPAPEAEAQQGDLAGMRVWMVEDDAMVRDALARQFAAWGVDHAFAATRAEVAALRDSDGDWPDAAILDDMLGGGESGLDIARWLALEMPKDRIVLVTGNVEPAGVKALAESGFKVLRKPLSGVVLADWLHHASGPPALATAGRAGAPAG